jgi:hypothetical protein
VSEDSGRAAVLLGGTILAIVAGLLSYIGAGKDIVLSTVVGLQVEAMTLLVETLLTISRRQQLAGRAARLMERLEAIPELEIQFDEMSKHLFSIRERYKGTIAPAEAFRLISECQSQIRDLSIGHLFRDSYDPTLKMQLLSQKPGILRTTSLQTHDLAWQRSEVGRAYWQAQLEAMGRGWTIERIFIYQDWSQELNDLAIEQLNKGVRIYRIAQKNVPHEVRVDFSIWNDDHVYQQWIRRVEGLLEDRFTVEQGDVIKYLHMWARLHSLAEKCTEEMLSSPLGRNESG